MQWGFMVPLIGLVEVELSPAVRHHSGSKVLRRCLFLATQVLNSFLKKFFGPTQT